MLEKTNIDNIKRLILCISHEINNPLNTISLNAQLLKRTTNEDILKRAAIIDSSVDRLKNIISQMLQSVNNHPRHIKNAKIIDLKKFKERKMFHL
ncbi:MAG TPA: histidine kinase dimerization/phospho-acceptor domain-containing protein [Nitrospinota bacterium]|nr:histidine kinase dimerization/phospho-acceptor domain-containing protein [Nitrospinota bacterium]